MIKYFSRRRRTAVELAQLGGGVQGASCPLHEKVNNES